MFGNWTNYSKICWENRNDTNTAASNIKISELTITDHGSTNLIELDNGGFLTTNPLGNGFQVLDSNGNDITSLMNQALAPNASIFLQGCHTGGADNFLGLTGSNLNSLAAQMSLALPGRFVYGGKRYLARIGLDTVFGTLEEFQNGADLGGY
jgi:hypothetical protein